MALHAEGAFFAIFAGRRIPCPEGTLTTLEALAGIFRTWLELAPRALASFGPWHIRLALAALGARGIGFALTGRTVALFVRLSVRAGSGPERPGCRFGAGLTAFRSFYVRLPFTTLAFDERLSVTVGPFDERLALAVSRGTLAERLWCACRPFRGWPVVAPEVALRPLSGRGGCLRRALDVRLLAWHAGLARKRGLGPPWRAVCTARSAWLAALARKFLSIVVHVAFASLRG
jgi:hypothetical protein